MILKTFVFLILEYLFIFDFGNGSVYFKIHSVAKLFIFPINQLNPRFKMMSTKELSRVKRSRKFRVSQLLLVKFQTRFAFDL